MPPRTAMGLRTALLTGDQSVWPEPALVSASVGIAMGWGTDVASESADVVLLGNDLLKLVETVRIARRARRIMGQVAHPPFLLDRGEDRLDQGRLGQTSLLPSRQ
jgi:hypothetical protein